MSRKQDGIPVEVAKVIGAGLVILGLSYTIHALPGFIMVLLNPPASMLAQTAGLVEACAMVLSGIWILRRPARVMICLYVLFPISVIRSIVSVHSFILDAYPVGTV